MAKGKKSKAPRVKQWKKGNVLAAANNDLSRLSREFYYWRYHEDINDSSLKTHKVSVSRPSGFVDTKMEQLLEYEVQNQPLVWHCLTLTYCRDAWGKAYLSPGYAKTNTYVKVAYDSIEPLMKASLEESERNMNQKHVYARAVVVAPRSQDNHDILALVKAQQKNLKLTDQVLAEIETFVNEQDNLYYQYDHVPNLDLDERIAHHFATEKESSNV
jgi:hypothetical protein